MQPGVAAASLGSQFTAIAARFFARAVNTARESIISLEELFRAAGKAFVIPALVCISSLLLAGGPAWSQTTAQAYAR